MQDDYIMAVKPTDEERALGVDTVTIARISGVQIAVTRTAKGFRSAGVGIPNAALPDAEEYATARARTFALTRLRSMRERFEVPA